MPPELIGAVKHLALLLRRYFIPVGNPPEMPVWNYDLPPTIQSAQQWETSISVQTMETAAFSAFLIDPPPKAIADATAGVVPLREVSIAINYVADRLEDRSIQADRLRYLFSSLCGATWYGSHATARHFALDPNTQWEQVGYKFCPLTYEFINDLEAAANDISSSPSRPTIPLGEDEHAIVELLRSENRRMTTTQILEAFSNRGEVKAESTTKQKLASLVRLGHLNNLQDASPPGYGLPDWS